MPNPDDDVELQGDLQPVEPNRQGQTPQYNNERERAQAEQAAQNANQQRIDNAKRELEQRLKRAGLLNPSPARADDKSIMGAIEHTTSWDQDCIAWWCLFTLLKFPIDIAFSWVDYILHERLFENAGENAFKADADGNFPVVHPLDENGNLDVTKELSNTEKRELCNSSKFDSDAAHILLKNGYIPPPSMATALKKQVVKLMEETYGAGQVQQDFPGLVAQVHNRIDAAASASSELSEREQAFAAGLNRGP